MSKLKRLLALSGLTSLLAASAFAAPGQAATVKGVCLFIGGAKAAHLKPDPPKKYVQVIGGSGTFTFMSFNMVCAGVDLKTFTPIFEPGLTVTATGIFGNTWCPNPTAKLNGQIFDVVGEVNPKANVLIGEKFAVHLAGGMGLLLWHNSAKGIPLVKPDGIPNKADTVKDYTLGGVIGVTPFAHGGKTPVDELTKAIPPPDKCTKTFGIEGVVEIHHG